MDVSNEPTPWPEYEARLAAKDPHGITQESEDVYQAFYVSKSYSGMKKIARKYGFQVPVEATERYQRNERIKSGDLIWPNLIFRSKLRGKRLGFAERVRKIKETSAPATLNVPRKSWSHSFDNMARKRRFVLYYSGQPHVQYSWAMGMGLPELAPVLTSHAPWLSDWAINYRINLHGHGKFFV